MTQTNQTRSFRDFWHYMGQKQNMTELLVLAAVMAILGIIFHMLYPQPFTFPDSGAYVLSAKEDVFNVYRPMGYSGYMSFVHFFGSSSAVLFIFSYVLNGLAILFLLFSAKYLAGITNKTVFYFISAFAIFAPRLIFSTNFIMSDSIFTTLTMLFLTTAIWLIFSRNPFLLILHLFLFVALFKIRYSGMFYIPVSMIAIFLSFSGAPLPKKTMALTPLLIFMIMFVLTKKEYREHTGVDTFSGFSGWQLINNAAVLLPDAKSIPASEFKPELRGFHQFIQSCPDTMFKPEYAMSTHNMWDNNMPYKQYMHYNNYVNNYPYTTGWVVAGDMYGDYAGKVIRHFPGKYFTKFIIPSFISNFKCWDFSEERGEFINEPLYRDYFGIEVDNYEHEHRIFSNLFPVRKVFNYIYWIFLGISIIFFCTTITKNNLHDKRWQASALILFFILLYIATATVSSPNTTWRYTMPVFVPSLIFMGLSAEKILTLLCRGKNTAS